MIARIIFALVAQLLVAGSVFAGELSQPPPPQEEGGYEQPYEEDEGYYEDYGQREVQPPCAGPRCGVVVPRCAPRCNVAPPIMPFPQWGPGHRPGWHPGWAGRGGPSSCVIRRAGWGLSEVFVDGVFRGRGNNWELQRYLDFLRMNFGIVCVSHF